MKKLFGAVTAISLMTAGMTLPSAYAADDIKVYVNGDLIECEQPPMIVGGRTLVPLRAICEALNCDVEWDGKDKQIFITDPIVSIIMGIDRNKMQVRTADDTKDIELDVPPHIYNDSTLVPARAVAEATYSEVSWDGATRSVYITRAYDWVDWLHDGYARMWLWQNNKWGIVDASGKVIVSAKYDDIIGSPNIFNYGLAKVRIDRSVNGKTVSQYGFIDKNGKTVIPVEYDGLHFPEEYLICARKDGKNGFLDLSGNVTIPLIYDGAGYFREGLAQVKKDGKWGYIDKTNKVAIPFIYDEAGYYHEGRAAVAKDGKWGFIDYSGKTVIPFIYDYAYHFSEGLAVVEKDGKRGAVDKTGKVIIPIEYKGVRNISEGLIGVKKDDKCGFIDANNNIVIPLKYESVKGFSEGLAPVKLDGKWGYIDKSGNLVIKNVFDAAESFDKGYADVEKDGYKGAINKNGIVRWQY